MAARLAAVQSRVEDAVSRRGPGPSVTLLGVSKRQPLDSLRAAHAAGLRDFGENYAQELRDKRKALTGLPDLRWHYVGALQSNKVKYVVGCTLVHTVDRPSIVAALDKRGVSTGAGVGALIEVNLGGEAQKAGVAPTDVPALLDAFREAQRAQCRGLMIIPPPGDEGSTRSYFRRLRELRDQLARTPRPNVQLDQLSMGMSADFEWAIEEGSTLVRVGTAIFGPRPG